jgi:hypothetical protein
MMERAEESLHNERNIPYHRKTTPKSRNSPAKGNSSSRKERVADE